VKPRRPTHYERLGVTPDATVTQLRDAYRRAARAAHPDRHGDASAEQMADVNEAWRVLSDAARRSRYDAELFSGEPKSGSDDSTTVSAGSGSWRGDTRAPATESAQPVQPARFPWRFAVGMSLAGIAALLIAAAFTDEGEPAVVDNLLQPGECVVALDAFEVAEASCDRNHDFVVKVVVGFEETCPTGTEQYRDRQGRGWACVVRPSM
jgi:DnaJ domain